jgi:hypothetical protein
VFGQLLKGIQKMSAVANRILEYLGQVDAERNRRQVTLGLKQKVDAIKLYQQQRFSLTYADLLATKRYGPAARFFLDELYGPRDFSLRDAQFARVVPTLVRLFPQDIVITVSVLAELHALSESLDSAMGMELGDPAVDSASYSAAWQRSCEPAERERQILLTVNLGWSLDRLTRKPLLRKTLRLMRGPALAAGLGELQSLLEVGFDAFGAMQGAQEFLEIVASRERNLSRQLFAASLLGSEWRQMGKLAMGLP